MGDAPPAAPRSVTVELFGVPRVIAGCASVEVIPDGATLGGVAAALAVICPRLVGPVLAATTRWPHNGYTFVVGGRFTRDATYPVAAGEAILLVASAAGG